MRFITESDLEDPIYSAADVGRATRLSGTIVQQWSNRALINSAAVEVGSRCFRRYRLLDIVLASVMARLIKLGVTPADARELASGLQNDIVMWLMPHDSFPDAKREHTVAGNGVCFVFDLAQIVQETLAMLAPKGLKLNREFPIDAPN